MYCDICHKTMANPYTMTLRRPGTAQKAAEVHMCSHCFATFEGLLPKTHAPIPEYIPRKYKLPEEVRFNEIEEV